MKLKWGPFLAPTIHSACCPCFARPWLLDNQRWNPDSSIEIILCSFCSSHSANMSLDILTSSRFLSAGTFSLVFRVISWHPRALRSDDKQIKGLCDNRSLNSLLICWSVNLGCPSTILAAASPISLPLLFGLHLSLGTPVLLVVQHLGAKPFRTLSQEWLQLGHNLSPLSGLVWAAVYFPVRCFFWAWFSNVMYRLANLYTCTQNTERTLKNSIHYWNDFAEHEVCFANITAMKSIISTVEMHSRFWSSRTPQNKHCGAFAALWTTAPILIATRFTMISSAAAELCKLMLFNDYCRTCLANPVSAKIVLPFPKSKDL